MASMKEINNLGRANYAVGKYLFMKQLETPGISKEETLKVYQDLKILEDLNRDREKTVRKYYIRKIGRGLAYLGSCTAGGFIGSKIADHIFKK